MSNVTIIPDFDPEPQPVLDPVATAFAAEIGIALSGAHAPAGWKEDMRLAIHALARQRASFTSDDLWVAVGANAMEAANPSALGSVFRRVASEGAIAVTPERRESQRPPTHGRPLRVWRSLVYRT